MPPLTQHDARRLSVESFCDPRTVRKAYAGRPITLANRASIRAAAERLGLPAPPDPVDPRAGFREGLGAESKRGC